MIGEYKLEEINALKKYIDGLPKDIQDGHYGKIYRIRLQLLYDKFQLHNESRCYIAK